MEAWALGLTDAEIERALIPAGLNAPEEVRCWWRWHNGIETAKPYANIVPERALLPLDSAVELWTHEADQIKGLYGFDGLRSPVGEMPRIYLDTRVEREDPVPVVVQADYADGPPRQVLNSFGELISTWVGLLESGVWRVTSEGLWDWNDTEVPPEILASGLV